MRDKKSLFEQVVVIIFGLSLIAGAGFLFFAVCTHAYSGPIASYRVNTSAYIGMGLAVLLLGFILFTVASYGLKGTAEYFAIFIGGLLGAAFRLVLALALFASPIMAFICVMRNEYANAAFWLVSGIVLYVVGQAFKTVPTAEELQQKELERERKRIEDEAQMEKWREGEYKKRMARRGDVLMSVRAPVGDLNIAFEDCCIGRGLAAIHSEHPSFCLYLMRSLHSKLDAFNGERTVFGSINGRALKSLPIALPETREIQTFEKRGLSH